MTVHIRSRGVMPIALIQLLAIACGGMITGCRPPGSDGPAPRHENVSRVLSHEETLRWITEHRAWRPARKTKPIWAREVEPKEVRKEFQTADHVKEVAREGAWLCVGVAGEPWFQTLEKINTKYEPAGEETKRFDFDEQPRTYRQFRPKGKVRHWAARVSGPGIKGFFIRPGYDPERPLYSPAGGYVLMQMDRDPYRDKLDDVWLVQEPLFEITYELVPDSEPKGAQPGSEWPRQDLVPVR